MYLRFAAGPVTKYSVRYNTNWSHSRFNSREIGQKAADIMLQLFDPLTTEVSYASEKDMIRFRNMKAIEARLPGNHEFPEYDV